MKSLLNSLENTNQRLIKFPLGTKFRNSLSRFITLYLACIEQLATCWLRETVKMLLISPHPSDHHSVLREEKVNTSNVRSTTALRWYRLHAVRSIFLLGSPLGTTRSSSIVCSLFLSTFICLKKKTVRNQWCFFPVGKRHSTQ